jgi:DNA-binding transcriptional ArsR family regulator
MAEAHAERKRSKQDRDEADGLKEHWFPSRLKFAGDSGAVSAAMEALLYLTSMLIKPAVNKAMDQLSTTFSALADPTRRAILARLARGSATVGELAEPFAISAPAISRHLKVLEQAKLIRREVEAQKRRCHLRPEALKQLAEWTETYRQFWSDRLDGLESYLDAVAAERRKSEKKE